MKYRQSKKPEDLAANFQAARAVEQTARSMIRDMIHGIKHGGADEYLPKVEQFLSDCEEIIV